MSLLDLLVPLSFGAPGYRWRSRAFAPLPRMDGQRWLVTGGNAGIGLAAAGGLLALGAEVWLLCRSEEKGAEARAALQQRHGASGRVEVARVDVSARPSVERFVAGWGRAPLTGVIHNAGVLRDTLAWAEGWSAPVEVCAATGLAGPLRLTLGLLGALQRASEGGQEPKVIWVASGGLYASSLGLPLLQRPPTPYDGVAAYARTKRGQLALARALRARAPWLTVQAMHPGWADTGGVRSSLPTFHRWSRALLRTPEQGADTLVYLAASSGLKEGTFWLDREVVREDWLPGTKASAAEEAALWAWLEACGAAV